MNHTPLQHPPRFYPMAYGQPAVYPAVLYGQPRTVAPTTSAPQALYVLGSFALMMVLAATMSVVGSVAALAFIDATDETPSSETQPAAALNPRSP